MPLPPNALIVAHGQPSDPAPAEAALATLAAKVAALLPGWQVGSATLAAPEALAQAIAGRTGGYVYPMFMAGGWFTRTHLPERLAQAGEGDWQILPPFGLDDAVQDLAVTLAVEAAGGRDLGATEVLLAAHGSFRSPAPSEVARAVAGRIARQGGIGRVETAFIDQSPRIAEAAATFAPGAICLPFFAAEGGHVTDDLPEALAEAGFQGLVLPPLGLDPRVPALIAAALRAAR